MSNQLYMDESNGNGVYAAHANGVCLNDNGTAAGTTIVGNQLPATQTTNTMSIMNGSATAAVVAAAAVAAAAAQLPTSHSSEDLSQSLSEYTDADESISAPTEFLAEFLSAVMLKDYKKALKYCKLILQYEPNNATAKEFYPLILDKLRGAAASDSDENYNKSSSPELAGVEQQGMYSDEAANDEEPNSRQDSQASSCNNYSEERLSLSECDDDDADIDNVEDDDEDIDDDDDDDVMSSSGDDYDLPIDEQQQAAALAGIGLASTQNGSGSSRNSSSGGGGRSDNTTHSYSSLLLEEEEDDDIAPISLQLFQRQASNADLDISNGNTAAVAASASCSDSESPTEPLTQRLAAILLSKCGVTAAGKDEQY